jgi:hypothetical protein
MTNILDKKGNIIEIFDGFVNNQPPINSIIRDRD